MTVQANVSKITPNGVEFNLGSVDISVPEIVTVEVKFENGMSEEQSRWFCYLAQALTVSEMMRKLKEELQNAQIQKN